MKISDSARSVLLQSASLPGSVLLTSTLFRLTNSLAFLAASEALKAWIALPAMALKVPVSVSKASAMSCTLQHNRVVQAGATLSQVVCQLRPL